MTPHASITDELGALRILKIEVDGHFHGGAPKRPWVARITGPCPKYGLAREFLQPMNDWRDARKAWSGNVYGVIAHFPPSSGLAREQDHGNPPDAIERTS